MLILTNKDVKQVLSMPECVSTLEKAYFDLLVIWGCNYLVIIKLAKHI